MWFCFPSLEGLEAFFLFFAAVVQATLPVTSVVAPAAPIVTSVTRRVVPV